MKSITGSNYRISSSGIAAHKHHPTVLSPWAASIGKKNGLTPHFSRLRRQTTQALLDQADLVIFMNRDVYDDARRLFLLNNAKCLTWRIKDRGDWRQKLLPAEIRVRTFRHIKRNVRSLIKTIETGGWVDIVDEHNQPLGFRLPITIANQKAQWHRGCHALITVPGGATIIQKRSSKIIFSPGLLDVTLGGHVDLDETPVAAAVREISEELGIAAREQDLQLLEVYKWAAYHPRYKRHNMCFLYTYHLPLTEKPQQFPLQREEVAAVKILPPKQLKRLLRTYSLKRLGRLNYAHAYYRRIASLAGVLDEA